MNSILRRNAVLSCGLAAVVFVVFIGLPFLADEFGFQFGAIWPILSMATLILLAIAFIYVFASTIRQLWRRVSDRSGLP